MTRSSAPWNWRSRKRLSDGELAVVIGNPKVEVHVLYVDGVPAGFCEFDRRVAGEVEIVQFGLTPEFIGQGLGKYFLQWAIDKAWSDPIKRLWLHTCTHDSPVALPNYLKAGFTVFKETTGDPFANKPPHGPVLLGRPCRPSLPWKMIDWLNPWVRWTVQ